MTFSLPLPSCILNSSTQKSLKLFRRKWYAMYLIRKKGSNNNEKQNKNWNKTVSQISNCHFLLLSFYQGYVKGEESLMQIFFETSTTHSFFNWWTFTETANQNYFRSAILASSLGPWKSSGKPFYWSQLTAHFFVLVCFFLEYFSFYFIEGAQFKY